MPSPLRITTSDFFFQLNPCGHSPYVTSSLMRRWVCHLHLLLALASTVILGSESSGTHDHILLSQIQVSSILEGQIPIFISPRNRVAQLYPQAPSSLFVTSYDSRVMVVAFEPASTWGTDWAQSESGSELLYEWRFTAPQFVLATSSLRLTTNNFFSTEHLLLALTSAVILRFKSHALMTFYCLRFKTPPTWRARSLYLYPLGTGWPSYSSRHCAPFSLPHTTCRATVEVFDPASTWGILPDHALNLVSLITALHWHVENTTSVTAPLLHSCPLPWERVYRAVA
jgi:hypothetical protein